MSLGRKQRQGESIICSRDRLGVKTGRVDKGYRALFLKPFDHVCTASSSVMTLHFAKMNCFDTRNEQRDLRTQHL